ncbi:uncharacterized protein (TIGR03083 family) [Crossiella equi]|uniref:Uncharacterized protein (TIGR03083 family) n=1 Tax=Crossiella equi TaxID=130796 RepID=A0ABS5ARS1_9PSEU|nr:maleylpyruvate isomerase family mycothiol-dependent enzyme [Crossiella equi]MBP2479273.1 uncharacterized protein (TIGR03083 family) [Crossiella equi]
MPSTLLLATRERSDLAAFLAGLTPGQWEAPTLCTGWNVRQLVGHMLSYDELTALDLVKRLAKAGFRPDRANALGVTEYDRSPAELLALLRRNLRPRGLTAGLGGMIGLLDATIHHQDIRRALDLPRPIPADRLRVVLRLAFFAPPIQAFVRARGLRLVATDIEFTRGSGPEVRGPGEALLMATAGRGQALADLAGPGLATLAARMPGQATG